MAPPSSKTEQSQHKLLAIPGPIEVTDEVLHAIAQPSLSHVSPQFVDIFRECIVMTRKVVDTKDGQPFILGGSGTLGWDQVAANLVEAGDHVLVLHTGYFGDGLRDCLRAYGAEVDELKSEFGSTVDSREIEAALQAKSYKAITITHVDTSTGVLSDAKSIAEIVRRVSPRTLIILDGVCSVASEEIRMDAWDIDVIVTASQKGLGAPPGLSILIASQRALQVFEMRSTPVAAYYASWTKWLPIMKAYGRGVPAYFGTPPVNLVRAYHASLLQITTMSPSLDERYRIHQQVSQRIKAIASQLGLKQVPRDAAQAANGMTALYLPDGIGASDILPRLAAKGVVMAGGLIGDIKDKYIRIGHMGTSVMDAKRGDIEMMATCLQDSLREAKASQQLQLSMAKSLDITEV